MYISDLSAVDPPNKVVQKELETKNNKLRKSESGQRIVCEADVGEQGD